MLEKYTTKELKEKDTTGKEADKTEIQTEIYALCEHLDKLTKKLEHLRQGFK